MTFRTKLLSIFMLTVLSATGLLAWGATQFLRQEFDASDRLRSQALAAQFQREFALRGDEVGNRVQDIANAEGTLRMALDLARPQADFSLYAGDARGLAATHRLDFLELVANGVLISSVQYPGQIGNKVDWLAQEPNWNQSGAFLRSVDLPDGAQLALVTVRTVHAGNSDLYIIGGRHVDGDFLRTFVSPPGMRVLLYPNLQEAFAPDALIGSEGPVPHAERFAPLLASASAQPSSSDGIIQWSDDPASAERFLSIPLAGHKNELLATLLVGSEQKGYAILVSRIRSLALAIAAGAALVCILLGWWISARVSRPLARLETAAREIGDGQLNTQVAVHSRDEVGRAARAFNSMARKLAEQNRQSQQVERVAAWREIARRLAHEVKERLFPLQVAVENLRHSRDQNTERFSEMLFDSLATLTAELEKLKSTVARFSNFAKMPPARLEPLNVNDAVRFAVKAFEPHFSAIGRPPVTPELFLDERVDRIAADPQLLSKALESLLFRSFDAMSAGGTLAIRTGQDRGFVRIEVSDTGISVTPEERTRLFTPYYAIGSQAGGLGLATAQAVVTEHGGRISAESASGMGNTFRIEFPAAPEIPESGFAASEPPARHVQHNLPQSAEHDSETAALQGPA